VLAFEEHNFVECDVVEAAEAVGLFSLVSVEPGDVEDLARSDLKLGDESLHSHCDVLVFRGNAVD
jgi:hypothetical protein